MGDSRIHQAEKLTLRLLPIIKNLLRHINKTYHYFLSLTERRFNLTLFYLEELKLWDEFLIYIFYALEVSDDMSQIILLLSYIRDVIFSKLSLEGKNHLGQVACS